MASGLPWFKFMVDAHSNPKIRALSDGEFRLLTHIWALAQRSSFPGIVRLTEGRGMPGDVLTTGAGCSSCEPAQEMLANLVAVGLIDVDAAGVIAVHDWHDYNGRPPSWQPERRAAQKRKERERRKGVATVSQAVSQDDHNSVSQASLNGSQDGRNDVSTPEVEKEEEEDQIPKQCADPVARTPAVSAGQASRTAPEPWPEDVAERLRVALGRKLEPNDPEWAQWLADTALRFPMRRRLDAAKAFLDRPRNGKTYNPAYVFALIRDGVATTSQSNGAHDNGGKSAGNPSTTPEWKRQGAGSPEEYETWMRKASEDSSHA